MPELRRDDVRAVGDRMTGALTATEIHQLRTAYEVCPHEFGSYVSARGPQVERWEAGLEVPDPLADRLLRILLALLNPMTGDSNLLL